MRGWMRSKQRVCTRLQAVFDKAANASMRGNGGKAHNATGTAQDSSKARTEQEATVSLTCERSGCGLPSHSDGLRQRVYLNTTSNAQIKSAT